MAYDSYGPMYAVYATNTGTSGVMFDANINDQQGVFYKESDNPDSQPRCICEGGAIVAALPDINLDGDSNHDAGVLISTGGTNLSWAFDYNSGNPHSINTTGVSNQISNICPVGNAGFYFSTKDTYATLWFAAYSGGSFTLSSQSMSAYWQPNTCISWITATPGNGQGFDVMFTGDRCYRIAPPYPATRYTDGRQLYGASGATVTFIQDVSDDPNNPCPWYADEPGGICLSSMVITRVNAAVDGTLYFFTSTPPLAQLWKSDGTAGGTVAIYNQEQLPWYEYLYSDGNGEHYGNSEIPFREIAGIDGYLDTSVSPHVPRVYFWMTDPNPSCLWYTDGSVYNPNATPTGPKPTPITDFMLRYCPGPKIPGQVVGDRPLTIVKDTADPLFGTVYLTAGIVNYDAQTIYSLYKIAHGATCVSGSVTWNGVPVNAVWDSGVGSGSACNWLTVVETPVGGGVDNHTLYFRGGDDYDPRNLHVYSYTSGSGVSVLGGSPLNMDPSWLVFDYQNQRLYYFSIFEMQSSNMDVKLVWWS